MGSIGTACTTALISAVLLLVSPNSAAGEDHQQAPLPQPQRPDFLFRRPLGSIGFKAAFLMPREQGDLFAFVRENLTVDKGDFRAAAIGGSAGVNVTPRATVTIDYEFSKASVGSESRDYIGSDGLPIAQRTTLSTHNISMGMKIALLPAGRQISRFAWIRSAVVPYVGAGYGVVRYQLRQDGDFVDAVSLRVFDHQFISDEWGPAGHAFGGADIAFSRTAFLTVEGRYVWADAPVGDGFIGFDGIDLAGLRLATGISFSF